MAVETKIEPYELLIRWDQGQVTGLHKREIITILDGEEVLSVSEGKAKVLAEADVPDFFPAPDAVANVSRLLEDLRVRDSQIVDLSAERDNLAADLDAARKEIQRLADIVDGAAL